MRTLFVSVPLLAGTILIAAATPPARSVGPAEFSVVEATIPQMQQAMADGRVTSRSSCSSP